LTQQLLIKKNYSTSNCSNSSRNNLLRANANANSPARNYRQFSTASDVDETTNSEERGSGNLDNRPSYLDNQATTPMDPRVLDKMLPYLTGRFGNPHSRSHVYGWDADGAVEDARKRVAKFINADRDKEIIFTSGATESNNLALKGVAAYLKTSKKRHMITTEIEHKCVLSSMRELSAGPDKWDITYLPVGKDGIVDLELLKKSIRPDTALVSVMFVNNEIGVQQKMKEIGQICAENDVLFHTDAAQAVGKIPIDVKDLGIHLMSISGHKLYGPKGIGALYVRKRNPRVRMRPLIDGGGQEFGMRSGTLATPLCVGLGAAVEIAEQEMENDHAHITNLANRMHKNLTDKLDEVILNGSEKERYIGNLNLSFSCVEGESLLMALSNNMSVSSGSACTSASLEPSYVLRALGVSEDLAHTSLRFGIGRFTTEEEVDTAVDAIVEAVTRLREMSPLWELHQEGGKGGVTCPKKSLGS